MTFRMKYFNTKILDRYSPDLAMKEASRLVPLRSIFHTHIKTDCLLYFFFMLVKVILHPQRQSLDLVHKVPLVIDKLSTDLQAFSTQNGQLTRQGHFWIWRADSAQNIHSKNVQEYGPSCLSSGNHTVEMFLNPECMWYVIYLVEEMSILCSCYSKSMPYALPK